jgi:cell fate (sporulation/competence/biofilm development) regulator YlbF (YheA/YmcA/DUF963 family)
MEQLIEMARRLGKKIAEHERTALLKKAQQQVNSDKDTAQLVEEYQKQVEKIHTLESQQKPVEVADKHKLTDIEQKISTNPQLTELTRRQADFVEMMRKIKESIDNALQIEEPSK